MSFSETIARKRDGGRLSRAEVAHFVSGAGTGDLPPEQLAAMLMAIFLVGMDKEESLALTEEMLHSGEMWNLRDEVPEAVDKHSTGGVGDTVSLVFAPLMAAVGVPAAMMAGRGLGHSQGTLDKLEAIPGFQVNWDRRGMLALLQSCGAAVVAQTDDIAPADRTLYSLRDITATVPSLPLIVGSIMSKKLALGAGTLILDVKCGSGAFRKTLPEALELAEALRSVARSAGVACEALITEMDQPLGPALGTACEVRQAVEIFEGRGSAPLREVSVRLAEEALVLRGRPRLEARAALEKALDDGSAGAAWEAFVRAHGGDPDPALLAEPRRILEIGAEISGVVAAMDGEALGRAAVEVGAGRRRMDEALDHGAGIEIAVRLGDRVEKGQALARVLVGEREIDRAAVVRKVSEALVVGDLPIEVPPLVYGTPEDLFGGTATAES
ncbi:MAG: thymidine phosphorylase [Thermoanaerobaculales bacterium]|nr:thymidine phosphorylase [Thermoanaerobaculales bacterium]